jgi:hypothetical protein
MPSVIYRNLILLALLLCLSLGVPSIVKPLAAQGNVYYVSTTGVDAPGNGTNANPWRTITYALTQVPDGSIILVKPGDYVGRVRLSGTRWRHCPIGSAVSPRYATLPTKSSPSRWLRITLKAGHRAWWRGWWRWSFTSTAGHKERAPRRSTTTSNSYDNDILKITTAPCHRRATLPIIRPAATSTWMSTARERLSKTTSFNDFAAVTAPTTMIPALMW